MSSYKDLLVYKRAFEFTILSYKLTLLFPKEEMYGLVSQFRRASVSVIANIVEGQSKPTKKVFLKFLYISSGSLNECECYMNLALALRYIHHAQFIFWITKEKKLDIF